MTQSTPQSGSRSSARKAGLTGSKRYRVFVKKLVAAGAEVRKPIGQGHPRIFYRGEFVASLSWTPSDGRAEKNVLAKCRRAGMDI
ncbi:HicA-like toxin [Gordonia phage Ennea]|nr:HicA-like toxin [Gordonia phage Ennea]